LLHQDVLDHLHILLNYQWDSRALLSLILVGLPELENQLVPAAEPLVLLTDSSSFCDRRRECS
jgi:type II secretory pathway predicted ATPase ExeA